MNWNMCMELEIEEKHDVDTPAAPIPPNSVSQEVPVDEERNPQLTAPS